MLTQLFEKKYSILSICCVTNEKNFHCTHNIHEKNEKIFPPHSFILVCSFIRQFRVVFEFCFTSILQYACTSVLRNELLETVLALEQQFLAKYSRLNLVCEKQKFIINSKTCRKKRRKAIILKLVINVEAIIQYIGNFLSNQMKIVQWNINLQLHLPNSC